MMENLFEGKYIKEESNDLFSSDEEKISTKMQISTVKKENDVFINTDLNIKVEEEEHETQLLAFANTSSEMCAIYETKIENVEPMVNIKYEDPLVDKMDDPLDVNREIKVGSKEQTSSEIVHKREESKVDEEYFSTSNEEPDSHENGELGNKNQLLTENKQSYRNKKHKKFTNYSNLDSDVRIHADENPLSFYQKEFICNICKNSFKAKGNLGIHMRVHSDEKPYVCNVCKKCFRHGSTLNKHMLVHSDIKPFNCSECNKSFKEKLALDRHKLTHTGETPYTCDCCERAFSLKITLIRHRLRHTGEKPYSCSICNKSFTQKSTLKKHEKIHKNK